MKPVNAPSPPESWLSLAVDVYRELRGRLAAGGYAKEIEYVEALAEPADSYEFFLEYCWVVINAGLREQVARKIFNAVMDAVLGGYHPRVRFKHVGKTKALWEVWQHRDRYLAEYKAAEDPLAYLETLPWIGEITKYHLARNFGQDVAKPDRHLVRIASEFGAPGVGEFCRGVAEKTRHRIGVIDVVFWRAANLGWI